MEQQRINMTTVSAEAFLDMPVIDTSLKVCVYDIGGRFPEVKKKLVKFYGENAKVLADGKPQRLAEVASAKEIEVVGYPDFDKPRYNVIDAERVIKRLTRPNDGCPWDRAQTHESIRINMIEEAYEAVDAIDKRDIPNMREEFGDVLLQSLLQSAIAERAGEFDFADVCDELCKKLISRHTFIFGGDNAGDPDAAITLWEKNKATEKHYSTLKEQLDRLPDTFPSLLYCQKTHKKCVKAGVTENPKAELDEAYAEGDYVRLIAAATALLSDEHRDAEVELNKLVKDKINSL